MSIEIHGDERDWEPGGIYYDGPYYTPEEDDEDYDDCAAADRDTYEAEHDYGDYLDDDQDAYEAPALRRKTYQAPPRRKPPQMPAVIKVRRYIDEEF